METRSGITSNIIIITCNAADFLTKTLCTCRVSDASGTLEMTPVEEIPLKKEHLDPYVSR